eukprot:Skav220234  [mRNA]  locus=scaffold4245:60292:62152:+ [translate_table: standard]
MRLKTPATPHGALLVRELQGIWTTGHRGDGRQTCLSFDHDVCEDNAFVGIFRFLCLLVGRQHAWDRQVGIACGPNGEGLAVTTCSAWKAHGVTPRPF